MELSRTSSSSVSSRPGIGDLGVVAPFFHDGDRADTNEVTVDMVDHLLEALLLSFSPTTASSVFSSACSGNGGDDLSCVVLAGTIFLPTNSTESGIRITSNLELFEKAPS